MGKTLLLCDGWDADGAAALAGRRDVAVVTLHPGACPEPMAAGLSVESAPPWRDAALADELDLAAHTIARTWPGNSTELFRVGPHFLPHYFEVDVFLELLEAFRIFASARGLLGVLRPERVLLGPDARSVLAEAVEAAAASLKISCERLPGAPAPTPGTLRSKARAAWHRTRLRRPWRAPASRGLVWAYPKIRQSTLVDRLRDEGFRFLAVSAEEAFWEKGIPYSRMALAGGAPDFSKAFDRVPLAFAWEGIDLAPLVRRILRRVQAPLFARAAALARTLDAFDGPADLVVTPDFLSAESAVVHRWAESRGIPRVGIQHGAPLADYWLHLSACWNRDRILAWGGERNLAFFRAHGISGARLIPTGSADNDRFVSGFPRQEPGDILLCTLTGAPFTSVRNAGEVNERLLADLAAAAGDFPGLELVAKPHPRQPAWERRILEGILRRHARGPARISSDEFLDSLLSRAALVATRLSSTAVEAGLCGIPVLHLDYGLSGEPWYTRIMEDPGLARASTADGIRGAIGRALGEGRAGMAESSRRFASFWERADGKSTGRVAAAIRAAAGGH